MRGNAIIRPSNFGQTMGRALYGTRFELVTTLIGARVSLAKVAKLMGHSSLNTTHIYTTPSEQDLEEAVGRLTPAR